MAFFGVRSRHSIAGWHGGWKGQAKTAESSTCQSKRKHITILRGNRPRFHSKTANFHTENRPSARPIGRGLACFSVGRFAVPRVGRVRFAPLLFLKPMAVQGGNS
jgi:hypothetical protein